MYKYLPQIQKDIAVSPNHYTKFKLEFLKTRNTLCDLYVLDCKKECWLNLLPLGLTPPSRRGHTFTYYKTSDPNIIDNLRHKTNIDHHHHHDHHTNHHNDHISNESSSNAAEFIILYGGSGVDEAKEYERPLNDVWAYDIARNAWRLLKPSGTPPVPTYNHSAVIIQENMYIIGTTLLYKLFHILFYFILFFYLIIYYIYIYIYIYIYTMYI